MLDAVARAAGWHERRLRHTATGFATDTPVNAHEPAADRRARLEARRPLARALTHLLDNADVDRPDDERSNHGALLALDEAHLVLEHASDQVPGSVVEQLDGALAAVAEAVRTGCDHTCPPLDRRPATVDRYARDLLDALAVAGYRIVKADPA